VALVALHTGAPILPVGLAGTEQVFPALRRRRRAKLTVTIGRPMALSPSEGRVPRQEVAAVTDQLMQRIALLLPRAYQGVYRKGEEMTRSEERDRVPGSEETAETVPKATMH